MTRKLTKPIAFGLFLLLVLAGAAFVYVASTMSSDSGEIMGVQTEFGAGNYVWQSLYVTPLVGDGYWANPEKPFSLLALLGSKAGEFSEVSAVQNNIYMNLKAQGVTEWSFSCVETITVKDSSGVTIDTVASQTVTAQGQSAAANQNIWVTGASFSANDFQTILNQPVGEYKFVVTLSNINLEITANGVTRNLVAGNGSSQNILSWPIKIS